MKIKMKIKMKMKMKMGDGDDRGIRMALLRSKPRRLGWSCEGCPDMVGADEDENRRWDMGDGI